LEKIGWKPVGHAGRESVRDCAAGEDPAEDPQTDPIVFLPLGRRKYQAGCGGELGDETQIGGRNVLGITVEDEPIINLGKRFLVRISGNIGLEESAKATVDGVDEEPVGNRQAERALDLPDETPRGVHAVVGLGV